MSHSFSWISPVRKTEVKGKRLSGWARMNNSLKTRIKSFGGPDSWWGECRGLKAEDFKKYIENQFSPEMNWDNYGVYWHVDHIKPCDAFLLNCKQSFKAAFSYTNLRPL